jgi:hypothetical protein
MSPSNLHSTKRFLSHVAAPAWSCISNIPCTHSTLAFISFGTTSKGILLIIFETAIGSERSIDQNLGVIFYNY